LDLASVLGRLIDDHAAIDHDDDSAWGDLRAER
jgi:hypothetical protein